MRESPDTLAPDADAASAAGAPVYVVTYIEVTPPSAADAAALIQRWAAVNRGTDGNECFDAMQRITRSHHFVAVERWRDDRAFAGCRASVPHADFIRNIAPLLISGIDERVHTGLVVDGAGAGQDVAAVRVVTHVDVPPPHKEECIELLRELAAASSDDGGRAGLEIHQQRDRPNHFSVITNWRSRADYDAHVVADHTKDFRHRLTPLSGALYDERLYTLLARI